MTYEPTPKQAMLLFDVLGRGGVSAQAEVFSKVEVKDRDALERAGFLKKLKIGRALWLEVQDNGWAWASDHLDASLVVAPAPKKSIKPSAKPAPPPKVPTLQIWLTHLGRFLKAQNASLADLLPQTALPEPPPLKKSSKPAAEAKPTTKSKRKPAARPDRAAVEADIRAAVESLQGSPQRDGVRLGALRRHLAHLDRATLDEALLGLAAEQRAVLMNLDNPRDIEAERDAAITHKGQLLQVLWLRP